MNTSLISLLKFILQLADSRNFEQSLHHIRLAGFSIQDLVNHFPYKGVKERAEWERHGYTIERIIGRSKKISLTPKACNEIMTALEIPGRVFSAVQQPEQ